MNKIKDFLEKNSQWLALGVGGLWLLFMIYSHLLASTTASVAVKGAPDTLGPGSVDQFVDESVITKIKEAMVRPDVLPDKGQDWPRMVGIALSVPETPVQLAGNWPHQAPSRDISFVKTIGDPGPDKSVTIDPLPTVPAPVNPSAEVGKSIVTVAGQAAPGASGQQRLLWATVFAQIPMVELQKTFAAAKIPQLTFAAAQSTMVLKVEVVREEQLPNGQFGNETVIVSDPRDLDGAAPTAAAALPPFPAANSQQAQLSFRGAATQNQRLICQPHFYVVTKGDGWHMPGTPAVQIGVVTPPPEAPVVTPPANTPRRPTRPPVTPRPTRPGGPGAMAPADHSTDSARNAPDQFDTNRAGEKARAMGDVFSDSPAPTGGPTANSGGAPLAPLPPANANGDAPAGPFMPSNATDINIWVHDLTVVSGKTYRYKIRYTLSNPVFGFPNLVPPAKAQLAQQFSIDSPLSVPTAPVTIPDTTSFFFFNYNDHKAEATFDIFIWGVGGVVKNTVVVQPGDLLDPTLKLTLVDVREVDSDIIALLMDENGTIVTHSRRVDQKNPDYDKLQKESAMKPTTP